jgi:hypothetical protein
MAADAKVEQKKQQTAAKLQGQQAKADSKAKEA